MIIFKIKAVNSITLYIPQVIQSNIILFMRLIVLIALLVSLAVTQSNGIISNVTCVQTVSCISTDYFDFIACKCLPYPPCGIKTCLLPDVLDPLTCQC